MVNVSSVERVIASIKGELPETAQLGFNMGGYVNPTSVALPDHSGRNCEWVGCVGGHAYIIETGLSALQVSFTDPEEIEDIAAGYMDLNAEQARALFFDLPEWLRLECVPVALVVSVLERLIVDGHVRWEEQLLACAA